MTTGNEPPQQPLFLTTRWSIVLGARDRASSSGTLALESLRTDYTASGREREFEHLKASLTAERGEVSYREIASTLQMTEGAARVALHRLRKRFREIFREEIASTVSTSDEVDDEIRYVVGVLSRG